MEKLKKTRSVVRATFTRTYTALVTALQEEQPVIQDVRTIFALFRDKSSDLEELNEKILNLMQEGDTTEDEMIKEVDAQDEYKLKYHELKYEVQNVIEPPATRQAVNSTQGDFTQAFQTMQESKRYKLPRIEPPKFSGDLRDWLQFWSLYKPIHEDETIPKEQKFSYLVQGMVEGSKAAELVKSFPPTPENYDKAVASLRNRFGNEELLVEMYVRELLKLVLNNTMNNSEVKKLSSTYDQLKTQLRALESLGVTTDMCAAMLYPLVESSLPEELLRAWQRHSTSFKITDAKDRLNKFMDFLEGEVQADQRIEMAKQGFAISTPPNDENKDQKSKKRSQDESKSVATAAGLLVTRDSSTTGCIFCDGNHASPACEKARKMTLAERTAIAKGKNACFNCLKINHSFRACRFKEKCGWCNHKHVLLMCRDRDEANNTDENPKGQIKELNLANSSSDPEVLLQTLRVKIINGKEELIVRAIIDTASHRSYVLGPIAQSLGYKVLERRTMIHSLFGGSRTQPQEHDTYKVHLRSIDNSFACNFVAYHQDVICHNIPKISSGPWVQELRHKSKTLSDVGNDQQPIALLIGADIAGKLYTGEIEQLQCGLTAVGTHLGWTIMGKTQQQPKQTDTVLLTLSMLVQESTVSDLWRLDVLGITDPVEKKTKEMHQREVLDKFIETTTINKEGRYETLLPWKETHPPLTDNRQAAQMRLEKVLHSLKSKNLLSAYQQVFEDWTAEGIIEKVPDEEVGRQGYYLPHRPVIKENSTTRIRPVFDASAKTKLGPSLNDCLETGPNLIELIPHLLIRFRERRVGVIADIRKAFLQISIRPEDRDNLRFLWKSSPEQSDYQVYRHKRVVFGVSSSPFILGATLDLHLKRAIEDRENDGDREVLQQLKQSFYVDNCVTSVNSLEDVKNFQEISMRILATRGFDLRAWEHSGMVGVKAESSVLGLQWNRENDTLSLANNAFQGEEPSLITKRVILSMTQKLFDPLGMICPVMICPKLLLQKLWDEELGWDTEVDVDIRSSFTTWLHQLDSLKKLAIPRWVFGAGLVEASVSLHAFVDASNSAYASVIYARVELPDRVEVGFVVAKARVAPKGPTTIPRLELLGATVGARLMHSVVSALTDQRPELYYWTDSSTVLAWIQREKQWTTFVWNRVQEIRHLSEPKSWRHISGTLNPADLPSRGCTAKQLTDSGWHAGPDWLRLPPEQWPRAAVNVDEDEVSHEIKKTSKKIDKPKKIPLDISSTCLIVNQANTDPEKEHEQWYMRRYSKYTEILRLLAWVLRFIENSKKSPNQRTKGRLTVSEIEKAEQVAMRMVQAERFDGEKDHRLIGMTVYKDEEGLLRLKTPVTYRDDSLGFRCPIILDQHHPLVRKLIHMYHLTLNHGSIDVVMNKLREQFWILSSRRVVQSVIRACAICQRFNTKRLESTPIPLPENRVRDAAAFEVVGVDLAGPLFLTGGEKSWVVLFTCAVYRAIHLELVKSLSTDSFLEALRRFIARRGRPTTIYCDNGTNFTGACNVLRGLDWDKIVERGICTRIEWKFNPPLAAWWGGWWERLVRMVKELLRRTLGRACLTYEELSTTLCDCEATINARPLTYLAEDAQQLIALSPDMFLRDLREFGVPDLDRVDVTALNKRVKYRQRLRKELRQRFRSEYLGQLTGQRRSKAPALPLVEGDVVFVGSDNLKRLDWPLGRVVQLFPGKDGETRVVKVKTASGHVLRPVQRLYPLEMSPDEIVHVASRRVSPIVEAHEALPNQRNVSLPREQARSPVIEKEVGDLDLPCKQQPKKDVETVTRCGRVVKKPKKLLD